MKAAGRVALGVSLSLLCACDTSLGPSFRLSGRVEIVGTLRDGAGIELGARVMDDADGVVVTLSKGDEAFSTTTSIGGAFRFEGIRAGAYRARVVLEGHIVGATEEVALESGDASFVQTIRIEPEGGVALRPNPLPGPVSIDFTLDAARTLEIVIARVDGTTPISLPFGPLDAGPQSVAWAGVDELGAPVTVGAYLVFVETGGELRFDVLLVDRPTPLPPRFLRAFGSMGPAPGQFRFPRDIAPDAGGHIYVADFGNHRIQRLTTDGKYVSEWGRFGDRDDQFAGVCGLAIGPDDHIYTIDDTNARVQKFDPDGTFVTKWGAPGTADGEFLTPRAIDVTATGDVYVADTGNRRIQRFAPDGAWRGAWSTGLRPLAVAASGGEVFVLLGSLVRVYSPDGSELDIWGPPIAFNDASGIGADGAGTVYVSDTKRDRVIAFTRGGELMTVWGGVGTGDGELDAPGGLYATAGEVFVVDNGNHRVQVFETP